MREFKTLLLLVTVCPWLVRGQRGDAYPEGFYAFEEAEDNLYRRPPKVRKPPYKATTLPCSGEQLPSQYPGRFSPKDTLCGDLNTGFIPKNPMGHAIEGQPYPFELIRNKTLQFFAKALPYLKDDPKIPKVAKVRGTPALPPLLPFREDGGFDPHQHPVMYLRHERSTRSTDQGVDERDKRFRTSSEALGNITALLELASGRSICEDEKSALCAFSKLVTNARLPLAILYSVSNTLNSLSESKNKDGVNGTTPTPGEIVVSVLTSAIKAGLKVAVDNNEVDSKDGVVNGGENRSPWSKILQVVTGTKSQSPISTVLDLVASSKYPMKLVSNLFPSRRRKPSRSEIPGTVGDELPPTPCPSIEEYVTPAFARNYQGVWKYVVQIPHEGYFTQTVQNIKCGTSRCEFTEGVCHESPRWVSLLVAEIYYPNHYFPNNKPILPKPVKPYDNEIPPVEDFHNFQQYLRRRVGGQQGQQQHPGYSGSPVPGRSPGDYRRRFPYRREHWESLERRRRQTTSPKKTKTKKEKCDGHDQVGCYIVRMYYDWFLVNGSCKCWKPRAKRMLSGRSKRETCKLNPKY